MEHLEKVEKLRQRAEVSYEEAKEALEACDWDLLEAMVYLEKAGKVQGPAQETYSTSYEEQTQYVSVVDTVQEQEEKQRQDSFGAKMERFFKMLWEKCRDNQFYVTKNGEEILKMPVWVLLLALLMAWGFLILVMVIALFFGYHYSFQGKDNLQGVNDVLEKASEFADRVKDEFERL